MSIVPIISSLYVNNPSAHRFGGAAMVAAPWILGAVTIYGLYDVYVGVKTGGKMSAADQIVNTVDDVNKYSH